MSKVTKYKYWRPEFNSDPDDCWEFETDALNLEYIAREAAMHCHNRDCYESSNWPTEFVIMNMNGDELGRFEVDRDIKPVFSARKKRS